MEEPYKKPMLKFFDISKGKSKAGELLAAFELIELDYSSFGEVSTAFCDRSAERSVGKECSA